MNVQQMRKYVSTQRKNGANWLAIGRSLRKQGYKGATTRSALYQHYRSHLDTQSNSRTSTGSRSAIGTGFRASANSVVTRNLEAWASVPRRFHPVLSFINSNRSLSRAERNRLLTFIQSMR
jgi:hypothetical protein